MMFDFKTVIKKLGLGEMISQPQRVAGGYLHKMFRLETTTGKYAVKLLNPVIMKRPGVLENYKRAEHIEQILSEHHIPIVPALEIHGVRMQKADGQYFYLFEWTDAKALDWHGIRKQHCEAAGELLARIHNIPLHGMSFEYTISDRKFHVDWDGYIRLAQKMQSELSEELERNRELLYQAQQAYNAAVDIVPDIVCITDGDMDCKNVLWKNRQPLIIDLECLDYGNPFLEMFQLALSWAGDAVCDIDFARLDSFLRAYQSEYGKVHVDWKTLSGAGFFWLDWLEYNMKRALLIECGDREEQKLGICEAKETIRRIVYYHSVKESMLEYLRDRMPYKISD